MKQRILWPTLLSSAILAACGGGSNDDAPVTPVATTASVSVDGTAAKGLLAHAIVTVHAVNAGVIDSTALASTETDASGHYTLNFTATKDVPYVIQVAAKSDGTTTQLDEVTNTSQALPAGFAMRALFTTAATGSVSASVAVTPFTEMATSAAAAGTGGITAANLAQANANMNALLGFDPETIAPTTIANAAGAQQQQYAVMLTAVAKLAHDGALGCNDSDAGQRVKCVVETLASTTSLSSGKPGTTTSGTNASSALSDAVVAVVNDTSLTPATVSSALLTTTLANLAAAEGTSPTATPTAQATSIASAKLLFAQIRTDWTTLFSRSSATTLGAANVEANAFRTAMTGVQAPAEMLLKDSGALLTGIDLYNDYKAGRTNDPNRGRALDVTATDTPSTTANYTTVGCTLYQDAATSVTATSASNANFIGCRGSYHVSSVITGSTTVTTDYRHGFTITPNTDGSFGYTTRARKRVNTCTSGVCTVTANQALQVDSTGAAIPAFAGTVTTTLGSDGVTDGHITGFTITGQLGGAFVSGAKTFASHHHDWTLNGTRSFGIDATQHSYSLSTVNGSVTAYSDDGSAQGTLTVVSGSATDSDVTANDPTSPGELTAATLDMKWSTANAELAGTLSITDSTYDASGTWRQPTKVSFAGALRNKDSAGTMVDFINGTITAGITGYGSFNATQPESLTNDYGRSLSFVAAITAPSRPKLEISASSVGTFEGFKTGSLQYRTLVNGTQRMVIGIAATAATASAPAQFKLSEAGSGLSMTWTGGASSADLVYNNTLTIGTLDAASKLLTFSDGSFVSIDLGL